MYLDESFKGKLFLLVLFHRIAAISPLQTTMAAETCENRNSAH